jgi:hypothetical protein
MLEQTANKSRTKSIPAWAIALLIFGEILIVLLFVVFRKGITLPIITLDDSTIPAVFAGLVAILAAVGLMATAKKRERLYRDIPARLEAIGLAFTTKKLGLVPRFEGIYHGLKFNLAFNLGSKESPDGYTVAFHHEKPLNLRLICTNGGMFAFGRHVNIPFYRPIGAKKIEISDGGKKIKCWVGDQVLGSRLFGDNNIRRMLMAWDEAINRLQGRYMIDDSGLKMALPVDANIDSLTLEMAYDLALGLGRFGQIPAKPPALPKLEKVFRAAIFITVLIFMAAIALTIIHG